MSIETSNPTPAAAVTAATPRHAWSLNNEDFNYDSLDEAIGMLDQPAVGTIVYIEEITEVTQRFLCSANHIIASMGDRAYEEVGELAANYPEVSDEGRAELKALLADWMEKYAKPNFCRVINVREYELTAEDLDGSS